MNLANIHSAASMAAMEASVQRQQDRATQPCEMTADGNHVWQHAGHGLAGATIYECNCGAVEVRK
jgi:hypothetical protein